MFLIDGDENSTLMFCCCPTSAIAVDLVHKISHAVQSSVKPRPQFKYLQEQYNLYQKLL